MSEINMLMTVTKRSVGRRLLACYEEIGLSSTLCTLAQGTATSETLDYFGLEVTEKMVTLTVVSDDTWKQVKRELEDRFQIDVPGTGLLSDAIVQCGRQESAAVSDRRAEG